MELRSAEELAPVDHAWMAPDGGRVFVRVTAGGVVLQSDGATVSVRHFGAIVEPGELLHYEAAVTLGGGSVKVKARDPIVHRKVKKPTVYFMHKEMAQVSARTIVGS